MTADYIHIGGWIRQSRRDGANAPVEVIDFSAVPLNPDHVRYFNEYLSRYYYDEFVPGQGTEAILRTLSCFGKSGRWLDLGCGPTTLFWAIALDNIAEIHCADIMPEALSVLRNFVHSCLVPPCYRHVLERVGKSARHVQAARSLVTKYLILDSMQPWPRDGSQNYDLITAIGNFGLAPSAAEYAACFHHAAAHVVCQGRLIGADWIRSRSFILEEGHDNSYLSASLTHAAAVRAGFQVLDCIEVSIGGDPLYDTVIVWALQKTAEEGLEAC